MRAACALAAALFSAGAFAQAGVDADSADTHRRAKEGLAGAKALELRGQTLEIVGVTLGVEGLLRELNAEVRGQEVTISLSADVLFDFDKADLRKEARPQLEKVAAVLKEYPKAVVRIDGHTDGKGDDAYNQALSERRAQSVRKWLETEGVKARMTAKGWGKTKPLVPNTKPDGKDDPEGRQKNRRVEINLTR